MCFLQISLASDWKLLDVEARRVAVYANTDFDCFPSSRTSGTCNMEQGCHGTWNLQCFREKIYAVVSRTVIAIQLSGKMTIKPWREMPQWEQTCCCHHNYGVWCKIWDVQHKVRIWIHLRGVLKAWLWVAGLCKYHYKVKSFWDGQLLEKELA